MKIPNNKNNKSYKSVNKFLIYSVKSPDLGDVMQVFEFSQTIVFI